MIVSVAAEICGKVESVKSRAASDAGYDNKQKKNDKKKKKKKKKSKRK